MAAAKKFINDAKDVVEEMVQGTLMSNPKLCRIAGTHVLARADYKEAAQSQVTLISGGGSGHEPAHAGFIGDGMLSGAVLGGVFASPSVSAVLSAIMALSGPKGCLLIVKNYTGDRLNFGIAMEKAIASGIPCEMVIVADDCALPKDKGITGRRGVAGTIFVHKVAGAAAKAGLSVSEVAAEAKKAAGMMGSMGVALDTCTLPGSAKNDRLNAETIEIGLGIHGEPGAYQSPTIPSDAIVDKALEAIVEPAANGDGTPYLGVSNSEVAVLVNSLGATSPMELSVLARRTLTTLKSKGAKVSRVMTGAFMTSLDMAGFSVSILTLDDSIKGRLDAPTDAPAWGPMYDLSSQVPGDIPSPALPAAGSTVTSTGGCAATLLGRQIKAAAEAIGAAEPNLTAWDQVCGDGDCGITMQRGSQQILKDLASYPAEPKDCMQTLGDSVSESMGGTSGALLEIFFRAAGTALSQAKSAAEAFKAGVDAMMFYGGGQAGYRTMLDALLPASEALSQGKSLSEIAAAATGGAEATKAMVAKAGRANWVNEEQYKNTPDPGAMAVAIALEAIAKTA